VKKEYVRCWEINLLLSKTGQPVRLYITYPENDNGYDLITCLNCGAVYTISVVKEIYIGPPLEQKIKDMRCSSCGKLLEGNYSYYPETFVVDGKLYSYKRSEEMPSDSESIVKEFDSIYE